MLRRMFVVMALGSVLFATGCAWCGHPLFSKYRRCPPPCPPGVPVPAPAVPAPGAVVAPAPGAVVAPPPAGFVAPPPAGVVAPPPGAARFGPTPDVVVPASPPPTAPGPILPNGRP
jgi:hypothetical protein